jgi:hypothetical protein
VGVIVGVGRMNGEGDGGQISLCTFIYMYENRTMKTVEIVSSRGKRHEGE